MKALPSQHLISQSLKARLSSSFWYAGGRSVSLRVAAHLPNP